MKDLLVIITLASLLVLSPSCKSSQGILYEKLESLDNILTQRPQEVLDSLDSIGKRYTNAEKQGIATTTFSDKNYAYYFLLKVIANNTCGYIEGNDSTFLEITAYYNNKKEYKNLSRALLYRAIFLFNINKNDSRAYTLLKYSEKIFESKKVNDPFSEALLYRYLGKIYRLNYKNSESEKYLLKSVQIYDSINNPKACQFSKLDLFWTFQRERKRSEAIRTLASLAKYDSLSPIIQYNWYNAFAHYHSTSNTSVFLRRDIANKYLRKMLSLKDLPELKNIDHSWVYYSLARNFEATQELDSAIFYGLKAIETAHEMDSSKDIVSYYNFIGNQYYKLNDYESSTKYYRNGSRSATDVIFITTVDYIDQKLFKQGRRFILNNDEAIRDIVKKRITNLYLVISLLTIIFSAALIALRIRRKKYRRCMDEKERKEKLLESELNKAKFLNMIHETSVGALPKLVDDVNKQAGRSRKYSHELSEDLSDSINSIRSLSKSNLSLIAKNESFLSVNPNVKHLKNLSDLETTILILIELCFSTKEISELLNTTPSRVRAIKAKLRDKIFSLKELPFDPEKTFLIFSKDTNHKS